MHQPRLSTANNTTVDVGSAVQQQPQPQTISFQKNTVTVVVSPTLPSTVGPTNTPGILTTTNAKTFRKINKRSQQQKQQQHQFQQHQHQHHHLLHQQQQQQLENDLDVIEVYVDPEPHVSFKSGGLLRQSKTLGRLNHQHQHHHSIEDQHGQWTNVSQNTSLQLLQLQQQQQHDYSYAYYEPGAVIKHTNIPQTELMAAANEDDDLFPPPSNSIRALLLKGKKNKLLVSQTTRQSYQTKFTQQQNHNVGSATASANCSNISTPENVYEDISASSASSSSTSITNPQQLRAPSHLAGSLTRTLVEEELRRVQNRHHKILSELNLSVEAMIMPENLPNISFTTKEPPMPVVSVTTASGQPLRLTSSSADNVCDTAHARGPTDNFISPISNSATVSAGVLQSSCLASDLDSGFSGSSGASYIGSLRLHKTNALRSSRSNNLSTTRTATAGIDEAAESQQCAFAYATQSCRSCQRADSYNSNATTISASSSSAVIATTSPRSIKHLLQIHQNTKQLQQQLHHHHLHQQQEHQQSQIINDDLQSSSGFFTRASFGCRILNCAKIRAAEDPGPVVVNDQPNVLKVRSFWNRKGWRNLLGSSTSSSNINDPG